MAKLIDPDSLTQGQEITINTGSKLITLAAAGNLNNNDPGSTSGVTLQCIYSFLKEEWKTDAALNKFKFPLKMYTKTDGIFINGWVFTNAATRVFVRDAGWTEGSNKYMGIVSLGNFDETTDQAYFQQAQGYGQGITSFDKTGNLNEYVDITSALSFFKTFLRIRPKVYAEYDLLSEQGISALEPVLYKLPLANTDDLKTTDTDLAIDTTAPYVGTAELTLTDGSVTQGDPTLTSTIGGFVSGDVGKLITIATGTNAGQYKIVTYTDTNNVDVDRNFEATGGSITFIKRPKGMKVNFLKGSKFSTWANSIVYVAGDVVQELTGSPKRWFFTAAGGTSNGSDVQDDIGVTDWVAYDGEVDMGTAATPVYYAFNRIITANGGTDAQVYDWMQRQLRVTGVGKDGGVLDINQNDSPTTNQRRGTAIRGNIAELLGEYVGDTLKTKSGLRVVGFANDSINNFVFRDITVDGGGVNANTWLPVTTTERSFPFKATGTFVFSQNLIDDVNGDTKYTMYFTTNPGGNFDTANAIIVDNNSGADITGEIDESPKAWDFDYTNNAQGGRTPNEDAAVTIVAQGLNGATWVLVTFTITKSSGQTITVNADDERNYANP